MYRLSWVPSEDNKLKKEKTAHLTTKNKNAVIEKFLLFPNPANDQLNVNIDFKTKQTITLKIINSIGQILYDEKIETAEMYLESFGK